VIVSDKNPAPAAPAARRVTAFPNQNIENNPMQSSSQSSAWMLGAMLDTSGKSAAHLHHPQLQTPAAHRNSARFERKSFPTYRCTGSPQRVIAGALPNRALPTRVPRNIDMNTAPDLSIAVHYGWGLP
jgi:hypothetical protein